MSLVGQTISRYLVSQKLGEGGMGVVYLATDTRLDRQVALKLLRSDAVADEDWRRRFVREAKAASALHHPGIVTIYDIDTADGVDFIAMEYLEGRPLEQVINGRPLPLATALDYGIQVADALAAAHASGIVHRDIKPANVMIAGDAAKVLDFGLAKLRDKDVDEELPTVAAHAHTAPGVIVGTAAYMSPEQAEGKPVDVRSDVFSFGAVLYEMFTGVRPFRGDTHLSTLSALLRERPAPLKAVRADVPAVLEEVVFRCLEKNPAARYADAGQVRDALVSVKARLARSGASLGSALRNPRIGVAIAAVVIMAAAAGGWAWRRQSHVRSAREIDLPEIRRLMDQGKMYPAFDRLMSTALVIPEDAEIARLRSQIVVAVAVRSKPEGANVEMRDYLEPNASWKPLGVAPIAHIDMPLGLIRLRLAKAGFQTLDVLASSLSRELDYTLQPDGGAPKEMVKVPGASFQYPGAPRVTLPDYWLDVHEVSNAAFKRFVDAGGYRTREFWSERFVDQGREMAWDEAMMRFRDSTGQPGPATWELGTYPEGRADYPVNGVSWYEAAAYAQFAGSVLPTVYHWRRASGFGIAGTEQASMSNFAGTGPAPVGRFQGVGPFGTVDTAGNVKEWCFNQSAGGRYILGGAWTDPLYGFGNSDVQDPFKRLPTFGFRTARYTGEVPGDALRPIARITRDYALEKPVGDDVFAVYRSIYAYDRTNLDARVDSRDDAPPYWRVERVSFRTPYGNDRMPAVLFVPKSAPGPLPSVVYFPGSDARTRRSSADLGIDLLTVDFLMRSGRAVLLPIYRGTYERQIGATPAGSNVERDLIVQWAKEVSRSVDYLESRPDIDRTRVAFYGFSLGAMHAPIYTSLDTRFKTSILLSGGLDFTKRPPEVEAINFAPRSTIPTLMVNGRYDFRFPYETSQVPLFRLLGAADEAKRHALSDDGHVPSRNAMIREILAWLDRYVGPVK
jgi:eukaryotic-like serine/threonine-protein kinase